MIKCKLPSRNNLLQRYVTLILNDMISILLLLLFPYIVPTELIIDWPLTKRPRLSSRPGRGDEQTHTRSSTTVPFRSSVLGRTNGYGVQTGRRRTTEDLGHGYGVDGDTFLAGLRNTILQKTMLKLCSHIQKSYNRISRIELSTLFDKSSNNRGVYEP